MRATELKSDFELTTNTLLHTWSSRASYGVSIMRPLKKIDRVITTPHCTHDDVIKWKHFPRYWPFEFPAQRPVMRNFDVFFDLRLNKRLSKQWWGLWFETPSHPLWRHSNDVQCLFYRRSQPLVWTQEHGVWCGIASWVWSRTTALSSWPVTGETARSPHDDVIEWKHFPPYWPFVRGIHRSPVNSPHKGQWRGALMFSLISAWINGSVNNRGVGDLRRHRADYDVTVMSNEIYHGDAT